MKVSVRLCLVEHSVAEPCRLEQLQPLSQMQRVGLEPCALVENALQRGAVESEDLGEEENMSALTRLVER